MLPFSSLPYPGLRPFRDYESDIFFGREEQTDELLARLDRCRFLAVTGASGCGKSSLVKAGMIPALNTGFMAAAGSRWTVCEVRPGDRPLQRLTQALARPEILGSGRPYDQSAAFVEAALRRGPLGLIEVARGAEPLHGANLLILVDQFEEIFRNRERIKFDEADAFVALLLACAQQSEVAIFVVITMRSDYLGECAAFHGLPEAVSDSQYLTPRLTHEQLEEAITGPARVFSGRVEDKLVTRLINDFGADSDQLPLLQHALARMWAGRDTSSASPLLTVEQYEAIGADKALSRHGDEIYAELSAEQRRIAEIMFKRLSGTEDGRRDVRYSVAVYEVAAIASDEPSKVLGEVIAVAEAFRRPDRCFLAVPDGPVEPPTLLDLSHESLIRQWQKLVAWVANEAESAEMYRRLRDWALRWDRGAAERWRGPDLASAANWRRQHAPSPAWAERYRDPDQPDNQFAVTERFLAASEQAEAAALEAKEMQRRRQLQRARWMAGASGFTAASLVAAILIYYLGYVRPVDTYYKDYVKVWGVPKGIDRLSSAEAKHRPRSFKITTAGFFGHVLSMEAVTSTGEPVNGIHAVSKFSPAEDDTAVSRLEYGYDSTARRTVAYEISMDKQQHLISRVLYSSSTALLLNKEQEQPHSRVAYVFRTKGALARQAGSCAAYLEYEYSPQGYEERLHYLDRAGNRTPGTDNAFGQERKYSLEGRLRREISLDGEDNPMNDRAGNSQQRMSYDPTGNMVLWEALDAAGQPIDLKDSNNNYQRLTREYDTRGNVVEEAYWHADGTPAENDGCYKKKLDYDERGNITRQLCLQANGQPTEEGAAASKYDYDKNDKMTDRRFFDREGRPRKGPNGAFHVHQSYNERGDLTETAFFDEAEKPTLGDGGYHKERITVDENGHPIHTEYLDGDGKRVTIAGGYTAIGENYDSEGNEVQTTYLDADDHPVTASLDHWASKKVAFDACGREIDIELADAEGHHRASIRKAYDEENNPIDEACTGDAEACQSNGYDGYARITRQFDHNGNITEERYYDEEDKPTAPADYVRTTHRYNDHNTLLEETSFQLTGESETVIYNGDGREVEHKYFGVNGNPVLGKGGWARATFVHDEHGNEIERQYFGIDGRAVVSKEGYAKVTRRYDHNDAVVEEAYFGASGEPVLISDGWARIAYVNDERGRAVERAHFGVHGEPVVGTTETYHRATRRFDDRGNVLELSLFGTDGQPLEVEDQQNNRHCARSVFHYASDGERTGWDCFDARGNPVAQATGE